MIWDVLYIFMYIYRQNKHTCIWNTNHLYPGRSYIAPQGPCPPHPPPPQKKYICIFFSPRTILVTGYSPPKKLEPAPPIISKISS